METEYRLPRSLQGPTMDKAMKGLKHFEEILLFRIHGKAFSFLTVVSTLISIAASFSTENERDSFALS